MIRTASVRLVTAASVLLLPAGNALAFKRSSVPGANEGSAGPCLFWGTRELPFVLNQEGSRDVPGDAEFSAARASFSAWTEAGCSDLSFADRGLTSSVAVGYMKDEPDNTNLVVWRESSCAKAAPATDPCWQAGGCNNKYKCWEHSPEAIAVTTTTFSNKTGEIFDADIELNGSRFVFTVLESPPCPRNALVQKPPTCVATDVANTLTHEAGHFLGLDHSEELEATMYRSAETGDLNKRTLHLDDLGALCSIYPRGAPTLTCVQERREVIGDGCMCGRGSGASLASLLLLVPVLRARRLRTGARALDPAKGRR